ncbi:MAG TPA: Rieske (2Fe-2S) protein [Mycobacteriales bacterium]|nr:Rieske (2Fe-2S) protein [Mycobacteriales bacterium]
MSCATCPSRRTVLAGAGAVAAAGLLTACGGGEPAGPQATTGADEPVITDLATLREQGSIAFESPDGKAIAVVAGEEVKAYSSVCTHNGCTVVWDAEEQSLNCPCHGSRFDPADGSPTTGPARTPLPAVPVTVDEAEGVLRRG